MKYQLRELRTWMIDEDCGVYEMLQEIPAVDEFEQHNEYNGLSKEQVKEKIAEKMRFAYGFNNNEDNPKCENFILFVDGIPVVMGGLMLEKDYDDLSDRTKETFKDKYENIMQVLFGANWRNL